MTLAGKTIPAVLAEIGAVNPPIPAGWFKVIVQVLVSPVSMLYVLGARPESYEGTVHTTLANDAATVTAAVTGEPMVFMPDPDGLDATIPAS